MCFRGVILAGSVALSAAPGCGRAGPVTTHPVSGVLLAGGRPAAGAVVTLVPAGRPHGDFLPQGVVHADGTFTITTFEPGDGAPEGDYVVRVEWREHPGRPKGVKKGMPVSRDKFGGRYSAEKSGLRATVRPGENRLPAYDLILPK